jgi:ubiquinone biosynthesis protein
VKNHLDRYRQIVETLTRHGLGFLVGAAGLERWLPFQNGLLGHERRDLPYTNPEHVRLALEQLGPTFVKLGQVLSTRPDLLPPEYRVELAKLQDSAPPISGAVIRDVIMQELGHPPEEAFASFDLVPLASASIGQAHAATLADGTGVVVKIRRPGVIEQVAADLEILQNLAVQASRRWAAAADYDLIGIAEEFAVTLGAELDYLKEGRNAERFAANFADDPGVHIPRIYWTTTTSRVLTLERIGGIKVDDLAALDAAGVDRRELATRAARTAAEMIFDDGFFHADPHPGNLFIEPGGRIGLIDFGMVGEVDARLREQLAALLVALTRADPDRVAAALFNLTVAPEKAVREGLAADLRPVIDLYRDRPLGEIPVGTLIRNVLGVVREHHLQLPRQLALVLKMVIMTEGMGVSLDPEFQLGAVLAPYARRLASDRYSPARLLRRLSRSGLDLVELASELPDDLRRLRAMMDAGGPEVHLRASELDPLVARLERTGERLVVAMIAAAFIGGVGDLVAVNPQRWRSWHMPLAGAGLGAVGTLASYLAWTARRRSRRRPG